MRTRIDLLFSGSVPIRSRIETGVSILPAVRAAGSGGRFFVCRSARVGASWQRWRRFLRQPRAMPDKTLFEKIRDREIPAEIVHEDDHCLAFRDISPQAPVHILIVPRKPIVRVALADESDQATLGRLLLAAGTIAAAEGIAESGFRLVINNGPAAGEAVPHLHVHLLGGRALAWPPG